MKNWQALVLSIILAAFLQFIWYLTAIHAIQSVLSPILGIFKKGNIMLYRVIAKRTSYEEAYIEAGSESEAIFLAGNPDIEYNWDDLSELEWDIDSVEEAQ